MLNKEQIREIISFVKNKYPNLLSDNPKLHTGRYIITGELIAKLVLGYIWPEKKNNIIINNDDKLIITHWFDGIIDADILFPENGVPIFVNFVTSVTHDRQKSLFPNQDASSLQITSEASDDSEKDPENINDLGVVIIDKQSNLSRTVMEFKGSEKKFLKLYELNCLQVGIDLSKEELYYTEEFEKFVETKQLLVTGVVTPSNTALDLIVLYNTIPCYCDLDEELTLLAQAYYYSKKTNTELDTVSYEDYQKANNYFPNLFKYFTYKKGDKTLEPKENVLIPEERLFSIASDNFTFILNYWKLYKRNVSKSNKEKFDNIFEFTSLRYYILSNKSYYDFKKEPIIVQLKRFDKMLLKHPRLNELAKKLDLFNQITLSETIYDYIRQYDEWVVGVLETNFSKFNSKDGIDYEAIKEIMDAEIKRSNEPLIEVLDIHEFEYKSNVEELYTPLKLRVEGSRMHHCVGGYSNTVETGKSRIFHIESDKGTVSTLEVGVSSKDEIFSFYVKQHKNIGNEVPDNSNAKIAEKLVDFLNEKFGKKVLA